MYLVTGSNGFIGRVLIKRLQEEGIRTRVLIRPGVTDSIGATDHVKFFTGDLFRPETLIAATKDIDIVIHLAGVTHAFDKNLYRRVNVDGTKNLVVACLQNRVNRIIYISTRAISPSGGFYSVSKMEAEQIIKNSSMDFTILRLAEVYGGNKSKGIENLIGVIRRSCIVPIIGNGNYTLQPVYIKDVIEAIISVCKSDKADFKIYNIAGPDILTYNDLVKLICRYMKLKRWLIHVPAIVVLACSYFSAFIFKKIIVYPDQISRLVSPKEDSIEKAIKDIGYRPLGFKDGLKLILNME